MYAVPSNTRQVAREVLAVGRSAAPLGERAATLLGALRQLGPFQGSFISVLQPDRQRLLPLCVSGFDESTRRFLGSREYLGELELVGMRRPRPPMCTRDLPVPHHELRIWSDHLGPAGFRDGVGAGLFAPDGRHIGMLLLHTDRNDGATAPVRDLLGVLSPALAYALDPLRCATTLARMVGQATSGAVVTRAGASQPLPGLPHPPVLRTGSTLLRVALRELPEGSTYASFHWPTRPWPGAGGHATCARAPDGLTRVTVLACPDPPPHYLWAVLVLSPPRHPPQFDQTDLTLLGLLVAGTPSEAVPGAVRLDPKTVRLRLAMIRHHLGTADDAGTALNAVRQGCYIPVLPVGQPVEG